MEINEAKSPKSRRYSLEEKAEVVAYVHKINGEKGRGGHAAATRKFNLPGLTVTLWVQHAGNLVTEDGEVDLTGLKLANMMLLNQQIRKATRELAMLRAKFEDLKALI